MSHLYLVDNQAGGVSLVRLEVQPPDLSMAVESARKCLVGAGDKWQAYEIFKKSLPVMTADEYEQAIRLAVREFGL